MPLSMREGVPLVSGGRDAKSLVVDVLSREFPLSAKQIYHKIVKQEPTASLTYQGVHKALVQLVEQSVVGKSDKGIYQLNVEWARNLKRFGENVESRYIGKNLPRFADLQEGESITIAFDTYLQYCYWGLQETYLVGLSNPRCVGLGWLRHVWPIVNISQEQFEIFKRVMSVGEHYVVCSGNTPLDRVLAGFLMKFKKKVKLGAHFDALADYYLVDDYIIQVYFSPKTLRELDRIYAKTKSLEGKAVAELYDFISSNRSSVQVVLMNDAGLSKKIRDNALSYFKK